MGSAVGIGASDVANLLARSFYRVFYPSEQKLPLLLIVASALTLLSLNRNLCFFFIPAAFVSLVTAAYTCVFTICAYLFLVFNDYFGENICDLFYWGREHCNARAEVDGVWAHFFETFLATSVMVLCGYLAFLLSRLTKLFKAKVGALGVDEMRQKRVGEMWVMVSRLL